MADEEWQLEAVHKQFQVLESIKTPYKRIPSNNFQQLIEEVCFIKNLHSKMNERNYLSPRTISAEIIKHLDADEIHLSFVVIVTNIEYNGDLCKTPVFVLEMSRGLRKFIDMNLTVYNKWDVFLNNNDFPPCQYCFPVNGQYNVGGKLKIDFASSPVAMKQNVNLIWKCLGFVVGVGLVVGSFFFSIPEENIGRADSLMNIAYDFVPSIRRYGSMVLRGVTIVQQLRSGNMNILTGLNELFKFLNYVHEEFQDEIVLIYRKVRNALCELYSWINKVFSSFFKKASAWAQHMFVAVLHKTNADIIATDLEVEELLEESRRKNEITVNATAIHSQVNTENNSGYANSIFRNAKTERALGNEKKGTEDDDLDPRTKDLLQISNNLAKHLNKGKLSDVQNIFESLSNVVKEQYKIKIKSYTLHLEAAKYGANGKPIDIEAFNRKLGIEGDPKDHFWMQATKDALETLFLNHQISDRISTLEKSKRISIIPMNKKSEDDVVGLYRCVGIDGLGLGSVQDLMLALKDTEIDLKEEKVIVNEYKVDNGNTSSLIMIRQDELTITVSQKVNSDSTAEGLVLITRTE